MDCVILKADCDINDEERRQRLLVPQGVELGFEPAIATLATFLLAAEL